MDGDFYVAASLATTLTKVALRYLVIVMDKKKQNVLACYLRIIIITEEPRFNRLKECSVLYNCLELQFLNTLYL